MTHLSKHSAAQPIKVPRSEAAAMQYIQLLAPTHWFWRSGSAKAADLPQLAQKFHSKFHVAAEPHARTKLHGAGVPIGRLVMYPKNSSHWNWWLLVQAEPDAIIQMNQSNQDERLNHIAFLNRPITWGSDYELSLGNNGRLTWHLSAPTLHGIHRDLDAAYHRDLLSKNATGALTRVVRNLKRLQMFAGVRAQLNTALASTKRRCGSLHPCMEWATNDGQWPVIRRLQRYDDNPPVIISSG